MLATPFKHRLFFVVYAVLLLLTLPAQADDFILSYWCGPPPTEDVDKRYAEVAEAGFNYAMLPCSGASVQGNKAILNACKKYKLKYIPVDSRIGKFEAANPAFKTNLNAVVAEYGDHPALGGYFVADEPAPGAFPKLAAINQYLLERDPKRLPFINLYPNYAPEWAIGPYEKYVEDFLTIVKPRLLSFDHYALNTDGTLRPIYFDNLEVIRRQGLKHGVPIGFIFQLTAHFNYRNPSEADLRWQANSALIYGARALLYFTYWTPTNDPAFTKAVAIIDSKGNRSHQYEPTKRLNAEINAWAPTLMKLKSTAVYHTAPLPSSTVALPKDAVVQVGEGNYIVGTFQHDDGSEWVMIMNRDISKGVKTTVKFDKGLKRLRELSTKNGKLSSVKLRKEGVPLELAPGAAKMFKLGR